VSITSEDMTANRSDAVEQLAILLATGRAQPVAA